MLVPQRALGQGAHLGGDSRRGASLRPAQNGASDCWADPSTSSQLPSLSLLSSFLMLREGRELPIQVAIKRPLQALGMCARQARLNESLQPPEPRRSAKSSIDLCSHPERSWREKPEGHRAVEGPAPGWGRVFFLLLPQSPAT